MSADPYLLNKIIAKYLMKAQRSAILYNNQNKMKTGLHTDRSLGTENRRV